MGGSMKFRTPEELADWHRRHVDTSEEDDEREVGRAACPWCSCRISKGYHEPGCPVRAILVQSPGPCPSPASSALKGRIVVVGELAGLEPDQLPKRGVVLEVSSIEDLRRFGALLLETVAIAKETP